MIKRLLVVGFIAGSAWLAYSYVAAPAVDLPGAADGGSGQDSSGDGARRGGEQPSYIAAVTRSWEADGEVYRVRPTRRGRLATPEELSVAWRQTVRKGVPDRTGLRQQFLCHPLSIIARGKPTWDLETWRPTVGLTRTVLAGCNPG